MEQVTQKTAANAEESASAAEELSAQSENLKGIVERLTAMVGGGTTGGRARPVHRRADGKSPQVKSAAYGQAAKGPEDAFPLDERFKEF
ncbi:hypothetical protein SBA4_3260042 [Candidatus Sulfopaludibacter sp. SbA4]|nr:hypothetical protein SBA4_3260042 [Candidatus Sulfopaludibacter sp. SbA4]